MSIEEILDALSDPVVNANLSAIALYPGDQQRQEDATRAYGPSAAPIFKSFATKPTASA